MPTRFPTGVSYITPGSVTDKYTFTAGDATPDVSKGTVWFTRTTSAITITGFDGGELGQTILVYSGSASVTTLAYSTASILFTSSATNLVMGANQCMHFLNIGSNIWIEVVPRN